MVRTGLVGACGQGSGRHAGWLGTVGRMGWDGHGTGRLVGPGPVRLGSSVLGRRGTLRIVRGAGAVGPVTRMRGGLGW